MTLEEKVSDLEEQVAAMNSRYQQAMDLMQFLGGSERVFQAALLAIISKHPDKASFREALVEYTERCFVAVHFGSESEAHAQGAEAARTLILAALDNS